MERGGAGLGPLGTIPARLDFSYTDLKPDIGGRLVIKLLDEITKDGLLGTNDVAWETVPPLFHRVTFTIKEPFLLFAYRSNAPLDAN